MKGQLRRAVPVVAVDRGGARAPPGARVLGLAGVRVLRVGARRRHGLRLSRPGRPHRRDVHRLPRGLPELSGHDLLVVPRSRAGHVDAVHAELRLQPGMPPLELRPESSTDIPSTHGANPHLGVHERVPRLPPYQRELVRARLQPAPQRRRPPGSPSAAPVTDSRRSMPARSPAPPATPDAAAFHTFEASSPGFKKCGSCHTMRHAGKKVATSRCASCHKGSRRPAGAALLVGHQEVRLRRLSQAEAARARA